MFTVYLTNMNYTIDGEFKTIQDAKAAGMKTGFEFVVIHDNNVIAGYQIFGGFQVYQ